ncbi:MAG: glycosyltransferase family 4 protein [Elusimicrobia bacterium]|nr:glycosyltransferase family 4 protein [Elusimicrobiota bacterium]
MGRRKVFHVITMLELGGAQRHAIHIVQNLNPEKFETALVCGAGGILDRETISCGKPVYFIDGLAREINPVKDFAALCRLYRLFRKHKPDIVHTNSSKAGILGRIAAHLAGAPLIAHTFHGFGFNNKQNFFKRRMFELAEKFCALLADVLIFVSDSNMETAKKLGMGDPSRYRLIRSGIKLSDFPAKIDIATKKTELGLPADCDIVLGVGNFKPQKNPLDFIRVAAKVLQKCPGAVFMFVGDGVLRPQAEKLVADINIKDKCFLLGWRDDVRELLATAKIFALTSCWEGLPRALAEAFASGLPAVCYDADGISDILKDGQNGYIIAQGNADDMAQKLSAMLTDEKLYLRLKGGAQKTDMTQFSEDVMVLKHEQVYGEFLGDA